MQDEVLMQRSNHENIKSDPKAIYSPKNKQEQNLGEGYSRSSGRDLLCLAVKGRRYTVEESLCKRLLAILQEGSEGISCHFSYAEEQK